MPKCRRSRDRPIPRPRHTGGQPSSRWKHARLKCSHRTQTGVWRERHAGHPVRGIPVQRTSAFIAKSVVIAPEMAGKGKWVEVPKGSYAPIAQACVVLKHGAETQSESARKICGLPVYAQGARHLREIRLLAAMSRDLKGCRMFAMNKDAIKTLQTVRGWLRCHEPPARHHHCHRIQRPSLAGGCARRV